MRKYLSILLFLTLGTLAASGGERPVVGFLTNGEGCNVDWRAELPEYDVADAGDRNFLLSQQFWQLDERLLNRRPDCCCLYSGLPEVLLGQPLPRMLEAWRTICERLEAAGCEPLILLTLPTAGRYPAVDAQIARLNEALAAFAAERRYRCFDPSEGLVAEDYAADGLMLGPSGLERFAANVRRQLGLLFAPEPALPAAARENLTRDTIRRILEQSPARVRVVLLGDSLTANGGDWNPRLGRSDVRNAGQGGYLTGQMLWLLDTCVIAPRPEICFVLAGINDLFNDIPPETVLANLRRIVARLLDAGIRPVVQPILLVHGDATLNARIRALDEQLREWCTTNRIDWLDPNPLLTDGDGLRRACTTDGTHLTEEGYAIWSGLLRDYLNTNLE